MLAESWDVSEDEKTYSFHLRPGLTFHNGDPVTSADVAWNWDRYMDPETTWRCYPEYDGSKGLKVEAVETPDDMTVVFRLNQPNSLFLASLSRTDCGQTGIYSPKSVGEDGNWIKPIGTGPFMLEEHEHSQYVQLARFPDYSARSEEMSGLVGDKTPLVDHVRFVVVPDASAAKAGLQSGDIDVLSDIELQHIEDLKADPAIKLDLARSFGIVNFLLQTTDPLIGDVRIREAIQLSLDVPTIVDAVTASEGEPSRSVVPVGSPFYSEVMARPYERDIARASELAEEAGYNGEPLTITATRAYPQLFDMAVLAQAMMAEAGFNVQVEVLDWPTLQDRYNSGNFQMMSFTYSARLDPALSYDMMSGDKAEQPRKVWDNPEQRDLLTQSVAVSDPAKRQELFNRIETLFQQEIPMIPLYSGVRVGAMRSNIDGYKSWALGSPRAWGVSKTE
ncbi:ABC transporter substrate-binding protein [Paracoccus onubensis]|nr:ABC transporter substrate-binding protein [Paracoccus onubensis]MDP0929676.1 ABC transporter substrate-binding protein [Paracoccus onubensis]